MITIWQWKHVHCNENAIYVFPEKASVKNFHILVSVSDSFIPRIGPHIFLQQNRQTDPGNTKIADRHMTVEIGTEGCNSFSGNICVEFSVLCLCSLHNNMV
jgi:hypothetical protein